MLTYVDWTPGRWGRVQTELLCPCGLPVLYLTARDVPARRVLRTLRRLRRAGDVRCAILPDALTPRAALCGIADPDETALRRALRAQTENMTVVMISQRASTIKNADRILVLDNGRIDGLGTHEELLKTNSIYQEVYSSQRRWAYETENR